jgi:hypothetical protein
MIRQLPWVLRAAVASRYGESARVIFEECVVKRGGTSSAAIGRMLGISKQASHEALRNILTMFRGIIEKSNYRGCRFLLRPQFLRPLRALSSSVNEKDSRILDLKTWNALVRHQWGMNVAQLGAAENLVVALVGLRRFKFPKKRTLQPILVRTDKKIASSLPCVASFIERTLVSAQPTGVGARELSRLVHGRFAGTELSTSDINALCRCLRTVEKRGDRYHALGSRADFYELVLRREGKPLHYRTLARHARDHGYRGSSYSTYIAGILSPDQRFVRVSRSGFWALAEWGHLETRTISKIASTCASARARSLQHRQSPRETGKPLPLCAEQGNQTAV